MIQEILDKYRLEIDNAIRKKDFSAAYRLVKARDSLIPEP